MKKRKEKQSEKCCHARAAEEFDTEETKKHVLAAGREILLAAGGALRFCKNYADATVPSSSRSALFDFFQKAITVADDLGKSITHIPDVKSVADKVVGPLFDLMGQEMASQKEHVKAKKPRRGERKK